MEHYRIPFQKVRVEHDELEYSITMKIPTNAAHRPAVKDAIEGKYYEYLSHVNFKKILDWKGNKSVIHAGTFFGDMLHTFSKSASTVYAFEAALENYFLARKNSDELKLMNVLLFHCALSDKTGVVSIKTEDRFGRFAGGASSVANDLSGTPQLTTCIRIDDLPVVDICLIQLDVEGHEREVLSGAKATIERNSPIILIEDNNQNCADLLSQHEYKLAFTKGGLSYWSKAHDFDFVASLGN